MSQKVRLNQQSTLGATSEIPLFKADRLLTIASGIVLRNNSGVPKCKICGQNTNLNVNGEPLCIACEDIGLRWEKFKKCAGSSATSTRKVMRVAVASSGWPELEQQRRKG
jgi:hypothetical protein